MASDYIEIPVEGGGGGGGVTSLNSATGALTLAAGSHVTVGTAGSMITVAAPGATAPATASSLVARDAAGTIEDIDPAYAINIVEHFWGYQPTNSNYWQNASSGSGARAGGAGGDALIDIFHPGIVSLQTGTTNSGSAAIFSGQEFVFGGGLAMLEVLVYMATLPDSTDAADVWVGFGNTFASNDTPPDTGVWFEWNPTVNSGNWRLGFGNGTATYQNSSSAPTGATWMKLNITVAADASSATFSVNGTPIGTVTNIHIPQAIANACNIFSRITKTAGTNSRTLSLDYIKYRQIFTTPL